MTCKDYVDYAYYTPNIDNELTTDQPLDNEFMWHTIEEREVNTLNNLHRVNV